MVGKTMTIGFYLAVGLLLRGELPEMLHLAYDPVAYERVSHIRLPGEEDVGPPVPPPPHCGIVLFLSRRPVSPIRLSLS